MHKMLYLSFNTIYRFYVSILFLGCNILYVNNIFAKMILVLSIRVFITNSLPPTNTHTVSEKGIKYGFSWLTK